MGGLAMCYICGDYAVPEYSKSNLRFLDDPSGFRCAKCGKREEDVKQKELEEERSSKAIEPAMRVIEQVEELNQEFQKELEKPKYDPDKDQLKIYWAQYNWLRGIVIPNQVYYYYENLTMFYVKDLPDKWRKKIPEDHHEKWVYIVNDNSRKKTTKELINILNERFMRRQLGLINRIANNRDMYYQCLTRLGEIDLKGDSLQQQISIDGAVKSFCEKVMDFFDVPYWGYVQDELSFMATARTTAYSIDGTPYVMNLKMMTQEYIGKDKNEFYALIRKTPFFFIICEKELVVMEVMEALRDLGYTEGWLGFNTQGYASTNIIRTLIEYRDNISNKFCVFSLHDYDVEGIKIFLDMKRYFNVESAGLNPELMTRSGIDFTGKGQKYRGKTGKAKPATIKGAMTIINDVFDKGLIDSDEKKEYIEWVNGCSDKRYELQSITGARLDEDLEQNPAREYAEYIQHKLEDIERTWDINRLREVRNITPDIITYKFEKPSFIDEIVMDLQEKITNTIDTFLESKNLKDTQDWRDLLLSKYGFLEDYEFLEKILGKIRGLQRIFGRIKAIRIRRKHKRYKDSLKKARSLIDRKRNGMWNLHYSQNRFLRKRKARQAKLMDRLLKRFPEYHEIKEKLEKIQEKITKSLEKIDEESEKSI